MVEVWVDARIGAINCFDSDVDCALKDRALLEPDQYRPNFDNMGQPPTEGMRNTMTTVLGEELEETRLTLREREYAFSVRAMAGPRHWSIDVTSSR